MSWELANGLVAGCVIATALVLIYVWVHRPTRKVMVIQALTALRDPELLEPTHYFRVLRKHRRWPLVLDISREGLEDPASEIVAVQSLGTGSFCMWQNGLFHVEHGMVGVAFEFDDKRYIGQMGWVAR